MKEIQHSTLNTRNCYHCGNECEEIISFDVHSFCCVGCKNVYELLSGNNLCDYYNIEQTPGIALKHPVASHKFNYLDDELVQQKLIEFKDKKFTQTTLFIPTIHCSSCLWLLENLYKLDKAILSSRVNFLRKTVSIKFSNETTLRKVIELLSRLGYEPAISLNDIEQNVKKENNRRLAYQIGVAGFCFGNSMLISFPEYFGLDEFAQNSFVPLFGYLNFGLSLPVFFFSAQDYFKAAYKNLRHGVISIDVPLALGIFVLFVRSAFEVFTKSGIGYFDTHVGLVFFLLIGKWFQQKTYDTLSFDRDYKSYFPIAVSVIKNDKEFSVPVTSLNIGDRILIRNNELIPADAILMRGEAKIDFSFVTGEAVPIEKMLGEMVYAGGRQTGEIIELEVCKKVSQSYLTSLWNSEYFAKNNQSKVQTFQQTVSHYFTIVLLIIAFGSAGYWLFANPALSLNSFTSVLIIACPCALALSSPFALGTAMRVLGNKKCYIKSPEVIEQMTKTQHIVFDKTGTITQAGEAHIKFVGELNEEHKVIIASLTKHSIHPLSKRISAYLYNENLLPVLFFKEQAGKGLSGIVRNDEIQVGSSEFVLNKSTEKNQLASQVHVKIANDYCGYFEITHVYRKELNNVIDDLKQNYSLHLLSGDNDSERKNLLPFFNDKMQFNQTPLDKLNYIDALQKLNAQVMMIGDGLNDAGALKAANVGISISENTANFSPASDIILDASVFSELPSFMRFSKNTMKVIYGSFCISLIYNIIGLSFAVQGNLSPVIAAILMPLSSISVIGFTTIAVRLIGGK